MSAAGGAAGLAGEDGATGRGRRARVPEQKRARLQGRSTICGPFPGVLQSAKGTDHLAATVILGDGPSFGAGGWMMSCSAVRWAERARREASK